MATQADGTVYINSSIDTDGFTAGGKEIEAAARRAAKTVQGIGDAARIALEKQTAAFVKSNQLYAQQEQKVKDIEKTLEEMTGKQVETEVFKNLSKELDSAEKQLDKFYGDLRRIESTKGLISPTTIKNTEKDIDALREKIEQLFVQRNNASGGKLSNINSEIDKYQKQLDELNNKLADMKSKNEQIKNSYPYRNATEQIDIYSQKVDELRQKMEELKASGGDYQQVDTSAIEQKLVKERERLTQMNTSLNVSYDALKTKIEQYGGTISEVTKKESILRKGFTSLVGNIKKAATAMLLFHKNTEKSNKSLGSGIKNILKYTLGISGFVAIFRKIRSAIKEGFENLYNESENFKNSTDSLKASMLTLKNSIAAAFAPLVEIAIPYIQRFVEWVTKAVNILGQFIAAITGQKTYTKAIKQTAAALKEENKASNKQLSSLDKLNNLTSDKGAYDAGVGTMFEEVPIDNKILDFINKLKNLLKPILDYAKKLKDVFMQGFWDGLGDWQYRWESIKDSIASIKDSLIDIFTDPAVLAAADRWAQSVAYMLGSLVGSLASIGLTIATNLLGGIAKYLEQNKDRIKQYLISMFDIWAEVNYLFADLFQSIAYVFEAFASEQGQQLTANIIGIFMNAFMGITELASKLFRDIATIIIKPFVDNKEAFRTALEGFLGVLAEVTGTIKQGIDDTFDKLNEVYDTHFRPFFESVAQGLSNLVAQFLEFWNGNVQPILDQWAADFDELWKSHIQPLLNNAAEFLGKIADLLKILWENYLQPMIAWIIANVLPKILPVIQAIWTTLKNLFGYIADMVSAVITILGGLIDFITGVFSGDWQKAFQGLQDMTAGFVDTIRITIEGGMQLISDLLSSFIEAWKSLVDMLVQAIQKTIEICLNWIQTNIVGKFNDIKNLFVSFNTNISNIWSQMWQGLYNKVLELINKIKSTVSGAFDWISQKMSGISSKLGSFGSKMSGMFKSYSISVPNIQTPVVSVPTIATANIPYLANGAVIPPNAPFAAILGDQKNGNNLELPESLLRKIVREESGNDNGDINLNLTVECEGYQLFNIMQKLDRQFYKQNGRHAFA